MVQKEMYESGLTQLENTHLDTQSPDPSQGVNVVCVWLSAMDFTPGDNSFAQMAYVFYLFARAHTLPNVYIKQPEHCHMYTHYKCHDDLAPQTQNRQVYVVV